MVIQMTTEEKILQTLNKIKPYLESDGGDVQFVKYEDGVVYVKLRGNCAGCIYADMTISNTIEEILINEIPEVIKVVNEEDS